MWLSLFNCTIQMFDWRAIDFLPDLSVLMFVIFGGIWWWKKCSRGKDRNQVGENAMGKVGKKKQLGSWDGKCSVRPHLFNAMDSVLHFAVLMQHRMMKILK